MNTLDPQFQKAIQDQLATLPEMIKDIILADEWKHWVGNIVKKNTLNLDQASSLESEIFVFLIGLVSIFDLRSSIQTELNIPVSKVNDIMIDVNDMIVEPLKQKLITATEENEELGKPAVIRKEVTSDIRSQAGVQVDERKKILDAIEETNHAPGIGVYIPKDKNLVEPIASTTAISAPVVVVKPSSIFESKMAEVVAVKHEHIVAPADKAGTSKGSDVYREPIN
jgi:hypothetical protein